MGGEGRGGRGGGWARSHVTAHRHAAAPMLPSAAAAEAAAQWRASGVADHARASGAEKAAAAALQCCSVAGRGVPPRRARCAPVQLPALEQHQRVRVAAGDLGQGAAGVCCVCQHRAPGGHLELKCACLGLVAGWLGRLPGWLPGWLAGWLAVARPGAAGRPPPLRLGPRRSSRAGAARAASVRRTRLLHCPAAEQRDAPRHEDVVAAAVPQPPKVAPARQQQQVVGGRQPGQRAPTRWGGTLGAAGSSPFAQLRCASALPALTSPSCRPLAACWRRPP
jgi:hypothetical protein